MVIGVVRPTRVVVGSRFTMQAMDLENDMPGNKKSVVVIYKIRFYGELEIFNYKIGCKEAKSGGNIFSIAVSEQCIGIRNGQVLANPVLVKRKCVIQ